jgi:branched-chain amino acid transport system substrate-binding protein
MNPTAFRRRRPNPFLNTRQGAAVAALAAGALLLTACGNRVSDDRIEAANNAVMQLSDDQLKAAGIDPNAVGATGAGGTTAAVSGATTAVPAAGSATAATPGTGAGTVAAPGTTAGAGTATRNTATAPGKTAAGGAAVSASAPCTQSLPPITLGQTGVFSGFIGAVGAGARPGLQVWAKDLNSRGGLACHPVQLIQVDDQSDPAKVTANVRDLVENKKVTALIDAYVPIAVGPYAEAAAKYKMPTIGGDNIDLLWNKAPYLFPVGASPLGTYLGSIKSAAESGHFTKFGMLYCVEATICGVLKQSATSKGGLADQAGVKLVYIAPFSLTQPDFTSECQNMKNAGVEFAFVGGDGSAVSRVARACNSLGFNPTLATVSLAAGSAVQADKLVASNGLYLGSFLAPFPANDTPGLKEYHAAFERYAPTLTLDGASMIAWSSGKLLEAAVNTLGAEARSGPLTTAMILKGLGNVKNETLKGLSPPMTFKPGQAFAPAINCYAVISLTTREPQFAAPEGTKFHCQ